MLARAVARLARAAAVAVVGVVVLGAIGQAQEPVPPPPASCQIDDARVPVMLLGSYHMSNPGLDRFNLEADDVRTPQRQAEIVDVIERLVEFRPTKVAVEKPWQDSTTLARYQAFRTGQLEPRASETEQIGFRLAHRLGHSAVHPIDVRMQLDDEALGPVVGANPAFQRSLQQLDDMGKQMMSIMANWLANGSVGEMLYNMNRPELIPLAHQPYVEYFVPMVDGDSYAGADMVATWYQRNLRIFANLTRITESDEDRLFVVYGQGHIPILRDLVEASPRYCLVEATSYLPKPVQQQAHDWLIVPGERVGPVTGTSTETDLRERLGEGQSEPTEIHRGEGSFSEGVIGYPRDPARRFEVAWANPAEGHERLVYIRGRSSKWHTAEGITLGTSLEELEALNGKPFRLMGFEWDYSGAITSWEGGNLEHLASVRIRLEHIFEGDPDPAYFQVSGSRDFSSRHPAMQRLNPTVREIVVTFD